MCCPVWGKTDGRFSLVAWDLEGLVPPGLAGLLRSL